MTTLIILGVILFCVYMIVEAVSDTDNLISFIRVGLVLVSVIFLIIGTKIKTEQVTLIKCLKGNNPYKMEIIYKQINDTTFIPVDTMYIKIK